MDILQSFQTIYSDGRVFQFPIQKPEAQGETSRPTQATGATLKQDTARIIAFSASSTLTR